MADQPTPRPLSPEADEEYLRNKIQVGAAVCAARLWARAFTAQERQRLGGELQSAWRRYGTAGMWQELRGVTKARAVVDIAAVLNLISVDTQRWLLRELGEVGDDPEEAIAAAVATGALVLVEHPRAAYWKGEAMAVDWERRPTLWNFFWLLCQRGKARRPIDRTDFEAAADPAVVTKQKSRLRKLPGFPTDLGDLIQTVGRNTQQLALPAQEIRLFELVDYETLREHLG